MTFKFQLVGCGPIQVLVESCTTLAKGSLSYRYAVQPGLHPSADCNHPLRDAMDVRWIS